MNETELTYTKKLLAHINPAGVVMMISPPEECLSILDEREDLIGMAINSIYHESTPSVIRMNGDPELVGRNWIFPVDMVILEDAGCEERTNLLIDIWLPRIIHLGVFVFMNYEAENYPYVKSVVDEKMKDFEQLARADTMIAFRVEDQATQVSWDMIVNSFTTYEREDVVAGVDPENTDVSVRG